MSGWLTVVLAGLLGFVETLLGVGVFLPGELMITGLTPTTSSSRLPWLGLAVVSGACAGDQLNYWMGRRWGPWLSSSRVVRRIGIQHWDRGLDLVGARRGRAVLLSRMLPVARTVVPAVAGVADMSPWVFSAASVAGSMLGATVWVGAETAPARLADTYTVPGLVVPTLVVALVVVRHARRHGNR